MLNIEDDNVVKMYSTFTPAENPLKMTEFYIVREYMHGTMKNVSLKFKFYSEKFDLQLSASTFNEGGHRTVKSIFFDICRGVQYLHAMRISHRVSFYSRNQVYHSNLFLVFHFKAGIFCN